MFSYSGGPSCEPCRRRREPCRALVATEAVKRIRNGSRCRTDAKAETTGYARSSRRAFDSQPRGRSRSAVCCPPRQRCALATRFRQWSVRRPSVTISNISTPTVKRDGVNDVFARGQNVGAVPFWQDANEPIMQVVPPKESFHERQSDTVRVSPYCPQHHR